MKEKRKEKSMKERARRKNVGARAYRSIAFTFKKKRCEICGYDEYDMCLDVHHIDKDVSNNAIENLAILCCICHRKLHKGVIESPW
jgi:5-methylcytosine-specific restriction endonuclease McrA